MVEIDVENVRLRLVFVLSFVVLIPVLNAHIADFDDVWQKRAEEAKQAAKDAYQPHPDKVANDFNNRVHKATEGVNSTRRNLRKYKGPCLATNPIDRCWRCRKNWAQNRKMLADCAQGFGHKTVGGKHGKFYTVTDSSDNDLLNPKPGTLRHAVIQNGPLWIIFARSMVIRLAEELMVTSDGRGAHGHGNRKEICS